MWLWSTSHMDSYLNKHDLLDVFVSHIVEKEIKYAWKNALVFFVFFLQRALSAERQVESLQEELVAAQNALQVCSTFACLLNGLPLTFNSLSESLAYKLFVSLCYDFISECKWLRKAKHGKITTNVDIFGSVVITISL